ncbi:hypothetical protein NCC49_001351 [Naganishia albida]|nr:hypothetical protein NCC49_001351 [Naganishia albida]
MDADDEDSHPVHNPRYRSSTTTTPHRHANHYRAPLGTHTLHSRPAENVVPYIHTRHSHDPVEKDFAVPECPLHDITNMSYAGAVDSQGNSWQNGLDDPKGGEGSYLGDSERNGGPRAPAGTQGETQFSGGSQSWQGATYQSYRAPATGLSDMPFTAVTSTIDRPASFALQHDLPILNVKTLSLISDLRDGVTDHPHASGLDLLAVIFEGGELKDIPRRRNEKTGMGKGHEGNLRLCNIKICQPNPYGGHPKMMVMDVTVWGDMAEQVASGDYRLVKGDVVWLKNLQFKPAYNGQDCSLQSRSTPASDYRIFYRTFPRTPMHLRRGARPTAEEIIDQQLRVIDKITTEPGIRRALQLAHWITDAWQQHVV